MTTTSIGSRRDILPLDLGPAAALRSYGRLGLVAVVIPAIVVGLLAAIYATATRAPAIVLVGISACASVFLLDVASRGLRGSRCPTCDGPRRRPARTDTANRDTNSAYEAFLRTATRSTGPASANPETPVLSGWLMAAEGQTHDDVREQVRTTMRRLHREGYMHEPQRSTSTESMLALAALALRSGDADEESRSLFQQAIKIDSSSVAHHMLALAVEEFEEGDIETARELFRRAIEVSGTRATSTGPQ